MYLLLISANSWRDVDDHRCAYCQTTQANSGQPDGRRPHLARDAGGDTAFTTSVLHVVGVTSIKAPKTAAIDPLTGEMTPIFHPRHDRWQGHFAWDESTIYWSGLTQNGRATINRLTSTIL